MGKKKAPRIEFPKEKEGTFNAHYLNYMLAERVLERSKVAKGAEFIVKSKESQGAARFQVLFEDGIRMEYSPTGQFVDSPTSAFWYRNQIVPQIETKEEDGVFELSTSIFKLQYNSQEGNLLLFFSCQYFHPILKFQIKVSKQKGFLSL